jgi:hypothetical protein
MAERKIVDMQFHASCVLGTNMIKQESFPIVKEEMLYTSMISRGVEPQLN